MPSDFSEYRLFVLIGVTGCGKSSLGGAVLERLKVPLLNANDFHPAKNIIKKSQGTPIEDEDRKPSIEIWRKALKIKAIGSRRFPGTRSGRVRQRGGPVILLVNAGGRQDKGPMPASLPLVTDDHRPSLFTISLICYNITLQYRAYHTLSPPDMRITKKQNTTLCSG